MLVGAAAGVPAERACQWPAQQSAAAIPPCHRAMLRLSTHTHAGQLGEGKANVFFF